MDFFHTLPLLKKVEITNLENDPYYDLLCKSHTGGKKRPFTPSQVIKIFHLLSEQKRLRDLVLFSFGIDMMTRCSDTLKFRVRDVQESTGKILEVIEFSQQKTKNKGKNILMPTTQVLLETYIESLDLSLNDYLFPGRHKNTHLTGRQYRYLIKEFASMIGLAPEHYSTHSMRRTKAIMIYGLTKDAEIVRQNLGQQSLSSTQEYLGVGESLALGVARNVNCFDLDILIKNGIIPSGEKV